MVGYPGRGIHGQTVELVARRILAGELGEGATIDIPALEAELDVSRTALREALKVLAAKGLVGARQKRGTFVRPRDHWNLLDGDVIRWQFAGHSRITDRFVADLTEMRTVIEPPAARFAASRRTEADLAGLDSALAAMAGAGSATEAVHADLGFHQALFTATHNELVVRMGTVLQEGLAARDRVVHGADPEDDPVPSHQAVLAAIRASDPVAAEAAMHALLAKSIRDFNRIRPH